MSVNLMKGQKFDLTKSNAGLSRILIGLSWNTNQYCGEFDFDLDVTAFLTQANGMVDSKEDVVYYDNLWHRSGGVQHMGDNIVGGSEGDDEQIKINLDLIPRNIERIVIAVTIFDAERRKQNFGQVNKACVRVIDDITGVEIAQYTLDEDFSVQTSVIVGEIYRYRGEWKFSAVGSGFNCSLKELCARYGVDMQIAERKRGAVMLKKGRKINLAKETASHGDIVINLNWSRATWDTYGSHGGIDLDLGCLYELRDGRKGVIQALGGSFGSRVKPPYILLDNDDTHGSTGENMSINGVMLPQIKRILIYTFIYKGISDWREADGVVTVRCPGRRDIVVRMDEYDNSKRVCAIAYLENRTGDALSIEKTVRFFDIQHNMDAAFGWGLPWVTGSKSDKH